MGKPSLEDQPTRLNFVSPEYFPALRIPLLAGRIWDQAENHRGEALAVVNQTFARRYFPDDDAVGHSLKISQMANEPPYTLIAPGADGWLLIVGVIADKRDAGIAESDSA